MNQIKIEMTGLKHVIARATIPTVKGDKTVQIMKAQNGGLFYVRSGSNAGAEAVFPTYHHMQQYYASLRGMTEEQFLTELKF